MTKRGRTLYSDSPASSSAEHRLTDAGDLFHEDTVTVTVEAAGTLALSLDTIAGDDTVNIAEKAAGFAIEGNTGSEAGVSVSVQVGTATLNATSADDNGTATWSVSVPADAVYITGAGVAVSVTAVKAGYTSPSAVQRALAIDLTAPAAPSYTAPATLTGRDYSLGWRLVRVGHSLGGGSFELSVEALRRESVNDEIAPEHQVGFWVNARF